MPKQKSSDDRAVVRVKFPPDELREVDAWIAEQGGLSRPEAIRRLVQSAIALNRERSAAKRAVIPDEQIQPSDAQ